MRGRVLLILVTGLLVGAGAPKDGGTKPPKEDAYYAKVEIQGVLTTVGKVAGEPISIDIPRDRKWISYPLNVSKLKGWPVEKVEKYNGRLVRVTGTLELLPVKTATGATEDQFVIVAETFECLEKDFTPPKNP